MKKTIIIGVIIFVAGALLAFIGFAKGGSTRVVWNNGLKIDRPYTSTKSVKSFKSINIDANQYKVNIKSGSGYSVAISGSKQNKPKVTNTNDTLSITTKNNSFGVGYDDDDLVITITVPNNTVLDKIEGSANLNDISLTNIVTNTINLYGDLSIEANGLTVNNGGAITSENGDLEMEDSTFNNVTIKQTDGDVSFSNSSITGGKIISQDGDLEFEHTTFAQTVELTSVDGDIDIENPTTDGYQVTSSDGSINLFGKSYTNVANQNENAVNRIIVKTTDADIKITQ